MLHIHSGCIRTAQNIGHNNLIDWNILQRQLYKFVIESEAGVKSYFITIARLFNILLYFTAVKMVIFR